MEKTIIRIAAGLVLIAMTGCLAAIPAYRKAPPLSPYDGKLQVAGLQGEVNIYRDSYGVPHLISDNSHDLFFAVGYTQASDRLWEMVLFRAIAEGRTSELLGRIAVPGQSFKGFPINTEMIDKQQRTMGMKFLGEAGAALLQEFRPEVYAEIAAYCDGVNAFINTHKQWKQMPIEFQVLRSRPEPWTPADVVSFGRFMGFYLGYNMMVELLRSGLADRYGQELVDNLMAIHENYGPTIVPPELLKNKLAKPRNLQPGGHASPEELGLPAGAISDLYKFEAAIRKTLMLNDPFASNNWIVSGKHTASGKPFLENDPHMLHMQPSMWYLMHVQGANNDCLGVSFPGTPFIALGHTRKLAWAATTSIADVQDLFVEKVDPKGHPGRYFYKGEWRPFTVRKEIIRVRIGSGFINQKFEVKQTIHGPIMTGLLPLPQSMPPVALRWVAWDFSRDQRVFEELVQSATVEEFMGRVKKLNLSPDAIMNQSICMSWLMKAKGVDDFIRAMDKLDLPSQNWMAADADGRIAYLPGGLIPVRKKGLGLNPVPGESGDYDWTGFIPTLELPLALDPERGWMISANNEVVDAEWYPYTFSLNYDSGWRAWRIQELLEAQIALGKKFTMDDFKRIQNDVKVKRAEVEVPLILKAIASKGVTDPAVLRAAEEFKNWDFQADLDSTATVIFAEYTRQIRRAVLADEVSPEDYKTYLSESFIDIAIELMIKQGRSPLFDDKTTKDKVEDLDDVLVKSIKETMLFLDEKYGADPAGREWGKVHFIKFFHPLGVGPLADLAVGPFPDSGYRHTVRCDSPADSGKAPFKAMNGTSWRHLIDLADVDNAQVIFDGSVSGQWLSPHYRDLHPVWVNNRYLTGTMETGKVKSQAKYHLLMTP